MRGIISSTWEYSVVPRAVATGLNNGNGRSRDNVVGQCLLVFWIASLRSYATILLMIIIV